MAGVLFGREGPYLRLPGRHLGPEGALGSECVLRGLVDRGLEGVRSMVSDDHEGIKVAGELSGVDWQRCVVYTIRTQSVNCGPRW